MYNFFRAIFFSSITKFFFNFIQSKNNNFNFIYIFLFMLFHIHILVQNQRLAVGGLFFGVMGNGGE